MRRKVEIGELERLYFDQEMSLMDVSKKVGLTKANVRNRLVTTGRALREPMKIGWANPKFMPMCRPTIHDIAWAAGIYEGEGSVLLRTGKMGFKNARPIVSVVQKDNWLCGQLRDLFGGTVNRYSKPDGRQFYYWRLTGIRGVGFLMTIYTFLSPRRKQQIRDAFEKTGLRPKSASESTALAVG